MTDPNLEQHLRDLPARALPEHWRSEILAVARREARLSSSQRLVWPPLLLRFRNLLAQHPFTAGALTTLWLLIFLFRVTTPVDPSEKMLIAHFDPNQPIYLVSLRDELLVAQLWQDPPDQERIPLIP